MPIEVDFLIVGAGIAGIVLAERLATQHHARCLLVEKRQHIGGNCFDYYDDYGVLVHRYGPHYFRTNAQRIIEYLSKYTQWHPVGYTIKSFSDNRYWSFPINLNTYEELIGQSSTTEQFERWLTSVRVPIDNPTNSEEVIISQVGWELYNKFFLGYTLKQWKRHPRELDPSVCARIPVRTNRDDRYLAESFQALPVDGYSAMFKRMLSTCSNLVQILLNVDYRLVLADIRCRHLIYTGPIDEFYNHRFGMLPYRSLRFENESFTAEQLVSRAPIAGRVGFWQPAMQVNYPNDEDYTRIVEIKHATGQSCANSTIVREYPENYASGNEPYYPIPAPDAMMIYRRYADIAKQETRVSFVGRLAMYRYYNMDQIVGMALAESDRISICMKDEIGLGSVFQR
jgi:UDP-galactopyranose mutase